MSAGVLSAPRCEVQREPGMCLGRAGTLARIAASAMAGSTSTSVIRLLELRPMAPRPSLLLGPPQHQVAGVRHMSRQA